MPFHRAVVEVSFLMAAYVDENAEELEAFHKLKSANCSEGKEV